VMLVLPVKEQEVFEYLFCRIKQFDTHLKICIE